jgi:diacylglycerol kinase (ATP)
VRILLAGNPASGAGRGLAALRRAEPLLRSLGATVTVLATEGPGHARRSIVSVAQDCGAERVVACGGDGLVSEVASALLGGDLPLAIVPAGRGNDLARALGVPLDLHAACDLALRGDARRIDAGLANGRPFVTVAACGLDAEISRGARASKLPLPGPLVYVAEILRRVACPPRSRVRLVVDGRSLEDDAMVLAVANTATYGGGFRIAPSADPRDGLLDACLIRSTSLLRTLALLPRVRSGAHATLPEVTILRGSRIEVVADPPLAIEGDGEPLASTPCVFECRRGALAVIGR